MGYGWTACRKSVVPFGGREVRGRAHPSTQRTAVRDTAAEFAKERQQVERERRSNGYEQLFGVGTGNAVRIGDDVSMQGQADDKPGRRLANPVYHISLNFAIEDKARLSDGIMAEIAREYMRRMGIVNTQYIVCRHTDTAHPHLHIVANRVDNNGNTISDRNDILRSVRICRELSEEYGLHIAKGKDKVRRDRLRGKDRIKYRIHDAVKAAQ